MPLDDLVSVDGFLPGKTVEPKERRDRTDQCRVVWYQWDNDLSNIPAIFLPPIPGLSKLGINSATAFDISDHIIEGENDITLVAPRMDIHAELEPIYLTGNFGVAESQRGWVLTELPELKFGSWKDQLRPFYSGSVQYQKIFNLDDSDNRRYRVKLNAWQGTVAEIKVNNKKAGIIGWQPYELDITESLNSGENKVEVIVTGSLKNLLGPHHKNPTKGFVTPWSFFRADQNQPPGNAYNLLDYGLMEDFDILQY